MENANTIQVPINCGRYTSDQLQNMVDDERIQYLIVRNLLVGECNPDWQDLYDYLMIDPMKVGYSIQSFDFTQNVPTILISLGTAQLYPLSAIVFCAYKQYPMHIHFIPRVANNRLITIDAHTDQEIMQYVSELYKMIREEKSEKWAQS